MSHQDRYWSLDEWNTYLNGGPEPEAPEEDEVQKVVRALAGPPVTAAVRGSRRATWPTSATVIQKTAGRGGAGAPWVDRHYYELTTTMREFPSYPLRQEIMRVLAWRIRKDGLNPSDFVLSAHRSWPRGGSWGTVTFVASQVIQP